VGMRLGRAMRKAGKWTASAVMLLLIAALAVSVVREARVVYMDQVPSGVRYRALVLMMGGLQYDTNLAQGDHLDSTIWAHEWKTPTMPIHWSVLRASNPVGSIVFVPLWIPILILAAPVVLLWRADRRAALRRRAGHCRSCGYSRRGLAPDAKCPECGAAPGAGSVRRGRG